MLLSLLSLLPCLHAQLPEYTPRTEPNRARGFLIPPLYSALIPGLDQFIEGQYHWGATHLGLSLTGNALFWPLVFSPKFPEPVRSMGITAGWALNQNARAASLFQSFRTAVSTRESDFSFLRSEESMLELTLAPFSPKCIFSTEMALTLPVMAAAAALTILGTPERKSDVIRDGFYVLTTSHMAGYSEELFFRGYLMPVTEYYVRSPWISNAITSIIFGAAHINKDRPFPIIQTIGGFGLGAIVLHNGWGLAKAIAAHTWYDVVVFTAGAFFGTRKNLGTIALPPLILSF
jgi:membrane protease YdiL (CAAX protease family)